MLHSWGRQCRLEANAADQNIPKRNGGRPYGEKHHDEEGH